MFFKKKKDEKRRKEEVERIEKQKEIIYEQLIELRQKLLNDEKNNDLIEKLDKIAKKVKTYQNLENLIFTEIIYNSVNCYLILSFRLIKQDGKFLILRALKDIEDLILLLYEPNFKLSQEYISMFMKHHKCEQQCINLLITRENRIKEIEKLMGLVKSSDDNFKIKKLESNIMLIKDELKKNDYLIKELESTILLMKEYLFSRNIE